jgi:hypothetical protein
MIKLSLIAATAIYENIIYTKEENILNFIKRKNKINK